MDYNIPAFSQNIPVINIVIKQEPKPAETPLTYIIKSGDNLTKIAEATGSSVGRLWSANPSLTDPDLITPETVLKVPGNDEVLPEREMPVTITRAAPTIGDVPGGFSNSRSAGQTSGWYYAGQCTAWVANKRYVPDGWGNATDWKWHAQAEGWTVSSIPVAGAIGWTYGHVVYVESVGDGVVTISEQNYDYRGSIRTITVPVGKYTYLY